MKVSLISTVKDASAHVEEFVGSVAAQTRQPDEVIVVDGGSTDGTPALTPRECRVVRGVRTIARTEPARRSCQPATVPIPHRARIR